MKCSVTWLYWCQYPSCDSVLVFQYVNIGGNWVKGTQSVFSSFKDFIYIFLEGKGGRKKGRETSMCERHIGCLSLLPSWGPGQQPKHVPWLETEPATFRFTGQHSIHWATRALCIISYDCMWINIKIKNLIKKTLNHKARELFFSQIFFSPCDYFWSLSI